MSSWNAIFADAHFAPTAYTLPIGVVTEQSNNQIALAPLQYVTDVEPLGDAFHKLVFPSTSEYVVQQVKEDDIDPEELVDAIRDAPLDDYYALLYLSDKNIDATEQEIKDNWKVISLYLHPDKFDTARRGEAEIRFKACQKAFETLTTPNLRIDYDSSFDFDDSVPTQKQGTKDLADFLKVYGPVFERNARFSKVKPVPQLGDADTTEAQLNKFYTFWFGFQSWREFPEGDTERVGDSASRDQRRDAAQKNKKARDQLKQQEVNRIRGFVQRANDIDPRLIAFKKARIAAKGATASAAGPAKPKTKFELLREKQAAEQQKRVETKKINDVKNKLRAALNADAAFLGKKPLVEKVLSKALATYEQAVALDTELIAAGYKTSSGKDGKGVAEFASIKAAMA